MTLSRLLLVGTAITLVVASTSTHANANSYVVVEIDTTETPPAVSAPASFGVTSLDAIGTQYGILNLVPLLPNGDVLIDAYPVEARTYVALYPTAGAADSAAAEYSSLPIVSNSWVSDCGIVRYSPPSDGYYGNQWMLENTGQFGGNGEADIDAEEAWAFTSGDSSVVVAVFDGEIRQSHSEFVGQLWTNLGETPGNRIDDDGNGYKDDIHGYHFTLGTTSTTDGDTELHGTACAGAVSAARNGSGTVGVAYGSRLMTLGASNLQGVGGVDFASAMRAGYIYAAENGARVLSCSIGCFPTCSGPLEATMLKVMGRHPGLVVCVALGNAGTRCDDVSGGGGNPQATVSGVLPVGNFGFDGLRNYSSAGSPGSVMGPGGGGIGSCASAPLWTWGASDGAYTDFFGGSSGATPHVAGIAALLLSDDPNLMRADVKTIILNSSVDMLYDRDAPPEIEPLVGPDNYTGNGAANAHRALLYPWVYSPNVTATFWAGDTLQIRWRKPKHNSSLVHSMIEFSTDGGGTYSLLSAATADTSSTDTLGTYSWVIPNSIESDEVFVKVTNWHGTGARNAVADSNDAPITIHNRIFGTVSADTTWATRVVLSGDVTVPSTRTLTIAPGTVVEIAPTDALAGGADAARIELIVNGTLRGNGSSGSHIGFFSNNPSPAVDDWYAIRNFGKVLLKYCDIQHARYGINSRSGADSTSVEHCTFEKFETAAVWATGAVGNPGCHLVVSDCTITCNDDAGYGVNGTAYLKSSHILNTAAEAGPGQHPSGHAFGWDAIITTAGQVAEFSRCSASQFDAGDAFFVASGSPELRGVSATSCKWGIQVWTTGSPTLDAAKTGFNRESLFDQCTTGLYAGGSSAVTVDSTSAIDCITGLYIDETSTGTYTRLDLSSTNADDPVMATGVKSQSTGAHSLRGSLVQNFSIYGIWAGTASIIDVGTSSSHGNNAVVELGSATPQKFIAAKTPRAATGHIQALYNCYSDSSSSLFGSLVDYLPSDCDHVGELSWYAPLREIVPEQGLRVRPNPSSGNVEVAFTPAASTTQGSVEAHVYDVGGRLVSRLTLGASGDGSYSGAWDGRSTNGRMVSRGIYFVRVKLGAVSQTVKIQRLK